MIKVIRTTGEVDTFTGSRIRLQWTPNGSGVAVINNETERIIATYPDYALAYVEGEGVTII